MTTILLRPRCRVCNSPTQLRRGLCRKCYAIPAHRAAAPNLCSRKVRRHANGRAIKVCLHCRKEKSIQSRGLCFSCWYRPHIRDLYPEQPKPLGEERIGPAAEPTDAPPGSARKMAVMQARLMAGQDLFHPLDKRDWAGVDCASEPHVECELWAAKREGGA